MIREDSGEETTSSAGAAWLGEDDQSTESSSWMKERDSAACDSEFSAISNVDGDLDSPEAPSIRITQHFFNGDGLIYSDHYYVVEVKWNKTDYSLDRSVLDFIELDRKLRKRFSNLKLNALPFNDGVMHSLSSELERTEKAALAAKGSASGGDSNDGGMESPFSPTRMDSTNYSAAATASSPGGVGGLFGSSSKSKPVTVASTDRMDRKIMPLTRYLEGLLEHHEVIVAEEFLLFFDEEAPSMFVHPSSLEALTIHDLLLLDEPVYKCIVRKKEVVSISVETGQLVVWKFGTIDYDIAFGIDLNEEAKIKYTRYNSHIKPVCGTLLVQSTPEEEGVTGNRSSSNNSVGSGGSKASEDGGASPTANASAASSSSSSSLEAGTKAMCTLKFDNSYAKLHTKKLQWSARVVNYEEYNEAKTKALDIMAEKKKFEVQRHSFNRHMIILAMTKGGVIHSSSVREDFLREESLATKAHEKEIAKLRRHAEEITETARQAERRLMEAENNNATVNESWKFTNSQLEEAEKKVAALRAQVEGFEKRLELTEMAAREQAKHAAEREAVLGQELTSALKRAKEKENENDQLASAMEQALRQADDTMTTLEQKLEAANKTIEQMRSSNGNGNGIGGTPVDRSRSRTVGSAASSVNRTPTAPAAAAAVATVDPGHAALNGRIDDTLNRISLSKAP